MEDDFPPELEECLFERVEQQGLSFEAIAAEFLAVAEDLDDDLARSAVCSGGGGLVFQYPRGLRRQNFRALDLGCIEANFSLQILRCKG